MNSVFVKEQGDGKTVVLLHGFPFNHTIWESFARKLAREFHVITPDLPGFGQSLPVPPSLTIDTAADLIISELQQRNLSNVTLIGHSLGGYVALAMVRKAPQMFAALGLFHSTAYADSEEKKLSRNKVMDFIDKNGVEKFTSNFIGPLFADQHHPAIETVKSIATLATTETVKAYTIAMRDRSDRTDVLQLFAKPILFITGEKDGGIPVESIKSQSQLSRHSQTHILTSVAHMGMVESEEQTLSIIKTFIKNNAVTS